MTTPTLPTILTLTPGDMLDFVQISRDIFPSVDGLNLAHRFRVRRWCCLLTAASLGYVEPDPLLDAQVRRLAAVFEKHDVEWLCELVQCATGDKYPA